MTWACQSVVRRSQPYHPLPFCLIQNGTGCANATAAAFQLDLQTLHVQAIPSLPEARWVTGGCLVESFTSARLPICLQLGPQILARCLWHASPCQQVLACPGHAGRWPLACVWWPAARPHYTSTRTLELGHQHRCNGCSLLLEIEQGNVLATAFCVPSRITPHPPACLLADGSTDSAWAVEQPLPMYLGGSHGTVVELQPRGAGKRGKWH